MPRMSVAEITTAWARIRALRAEAKVLEAEETDLKTRLQATIPPGTTKGGIRHRTNERTTTKWAKAYPEVLAMVPRSKQNTAKEVVEQYSRTFTAHTIEAKPTA